MTAAVKIRKAVLADLPQIVEIEARVFPDPWSAAQLEYELTPQPGSASLVALRAGRIIGYALARRVADEVTLANLAVDPPDQRQGVGQSLLAELLRRLRRYAPLTVYLEVAVDNQPARRLYQRFGFVGIDIRKKYYRTGADALIMHKCLEAYGLVQA